MQIKPLNSDAAVLAELGQRLAHARIERGLTQEGLAAACAVSKRTIERLETGKSVQASNLVRVLRGLGLLTNLNHLIAESGPGPIEQLKRQGKERRRASPHKHKAPAQWSWADTR
jgi:transcriptional regulator with XRE-family HTH domain